MDQGQEKMSNLSREEDMMGRHELARRHGVLGEQSVDPILPAAGEGEASVHSDLHRRELGGLPQ